MTRRRSYRYQIEPMDKRVRTLLIVATGVAMILFGAGQTALALGISIGVLWQVGFDRIRKFAPAVIMCFLAICVLLAQADKFGVTLGNIFHLGDLLDLI